MIAFDTNLAVYALNASAPQHAGARKFIESLANRDDVVVCEMMLVELYMILRNPKIFSKPMESALAVEYCTRLRANQKWHIVEYAPVMSQVWKLAAENAFAYRRIIDARLALTLIHHGVTDFATNNVKDFQALNFKRVWNPLDVM